MPTLNEFAEMFGKVPDAEIAKLANVTVEEVARARQAAGIDAPAPAPGATPASPKGEKKPKQPRPPKADEDDDVRSLDARLDELEARVAALEAKQVAPAPAAEAAKGEPAPKVLRLLRTQRASSGRTRSGRPLNVQFVASIYRGEMALKIWNSCPREDIEVLER